MKLNPRLKGLQCTQCKQHYKPEPLYLCTTCHSILEVTYDYRDIDSRPLSASRAFQPMRTLHSSLGEGNTPLIRANQLAHTLGVANLYLKLESANPTASFKDRPVSVGVSMAKAFGYDAVLAASTGNGAAAVAAYAARAGSQAFILVPDSTSPEKVKQAQAHGSTIVRLQGAKYSECFALAVQLSDELRSYNVTTTFYNPYTVEGNKAVGYELYEQLSDATTPRVYVPVGAGPLLVGISKGYEDYRTIGRSNVSPSLVGVQSEGNKPIATAYELGIPHVSAEPDPSTIAGGIADGLVGYEQDGTHTLDYINRSGGSAIAVSDNDILAAQALLAKSEGIFVEPSAAATLAGLIKERQSDTHARADTHILIMTGHGLKDMTNVGSKGETITTQKTVSAVRDALSKQR